MSWLLRLFATTPTPAPSPIIISRKTPAPSPPASCQHPRPSGPLVSLRMYAVDRTRLQDLDAQLAATFVQSSRDNATDRMLADANRDGCNASKLRQHRRDYQTFLAAQRQGMSRTDASAAHLKVTLLLASTPQFRRVLAPALASAPAPAALLDIGAGRGEATTALASAIDVPATGVTVMEAAAVLRRRLTDQRGFRAVASFEDLRPGERFGAVALLNVLDRCDDPMGLLRAAANALRPNGVLVVATVLPFCAMVYEGVIGKVGAHRAPKHALRLPPGVRCGMVKLGREGDSYLNTQALLDRRQFAEHLSGFVSATVGTLPLRVAAWTRVPYLSTGTTEQSYYHLDNALLVLRRTQ